MQKNKHMTFDVSYSKYIIKKTYKDQTVLSFVLY